MAFFRPYTKCANELMILRQARPPRPICERLPLYGRTPAQA